MSLWGATVITNLFSAIPWIGPEIVKIFWGGFSVENPTLHRFFALHYLLPFILSALILMHLISLHQNGSNNALGLSIKTDIIKFHPYCTSKDLVGFFWLILFISYFVFFGPWNLGEPDNAIKGNALVTPAQIVPEFYLLPFYAILRSIPDKLIGVIAMGSALLILIPLSLLSTISLNSNKFKPILNLLYWIFIFNFLFLMWLGAKHITAPYII
jgi:ubiquinol-cytochrome c reductase cytochrome b subunit